MASTLPNPSACCNDVCAGLSITVNTSSTSEGWFTVDVMTDLRALPNLPTNDFAVLQGDLVIDDGGGGYYVWRENATDADNGITWIIPDDTDPANPGRWKKVT